MRDEKRTYAASDIKVLEGLTAVRKRPAMYVGNTGPEGLHHLVYEVVDNSIDEALAEYCDLIDIRLLSDDSVVVIDNGRGIPVDMHETENMPALEVVMTKLHAGGKFDNKTYRVAVGLHGVGVSVVNALSEYLEVEVFRDGKIYYQCYKRGQTINKLEIKGDTKRRGTKIHFIPDKQIFETVSFDFDTLAKRMRELSFLTKGLRIKISDENTGKKKDFIYKSLKKIIGKKLFNELELTAVSEVESTTSPINTEFYPILLETTQEIYPGANFVPILDVAGTDMKFHRKKGVPCYGFCLMLKDPDLTYADLGGMSHAPNERCSVTHLMLLTEFVYRLMKKL